MVFVTNKPLEVVLQGKSTYACKITAVDINAFLNMEFPRSLALDLLPNSRNIINALQRKCSNMMEADIEFNPMNTVYAINKDGTHVIKLELT